MPRIDDPILCDWGYHLCRQQDLIVWLHDAIWEVELAPEAIVIEGSNKVVTSGPVRLVRRMHWDDRIARLYACDCAERIVHLCGDDPLHRDAIAAARRYTEGRTTTAELAAARDAVGTAVGDARTAAWNAARTADGAAAGAAAREYIRDRLFEYLEGRA